MSDQTPRQAGKPALPAGSLEESPVLRVAIHQAIIEAAEELDTEPSSSTLSAYYFEGVLPLNENKDRILDFLTVHPEVATDILEVFEMERALDSEVPPRGEWLELWSMLQDIEPDTSTPVDLLHEAIRSWTPSPGEFRLDQVSEFVQALAVWIDDLSTWSGLEEQDRFILREALLLSCFPVLVLYRRSDLDGATRYLVEEWTSVGSHLGLPVAAYGSKQQPTLTVAADEHSSQSQSRWLAAYTAAVVQQIHEGKVVSDCERTIDKLLSSLILSYSQVGKILGASAETVHAWQSGTAEIPSDKRATLVVVGDCVSRLLSTFDAQRLPYVVRRPADLFEGGTALDWILEGRIREVVDRYDLLLRYQV